LSLMILQTPMRPKRKLRQRSCVPMRIYGYDIGPFESALIPVLLLKRVRRGRENGKNGLSGFFINFAFPLIYVGTHNPDLVCAVGAAVFAYQINQSLTGNLPSGFRPHVIATILLDSHLIVFLFCAKTVLTFLRKASTKNYFPIKFFHDGNRSSPS